MSQGVSKSFAPPTAHRLRVVSLDKGGSGRRHDLTVTEKQGGEDVMQRLRRVAGASNSSRWIQSLLGKKEAIFEGVIILRRDVGDAEAQIAAEVWIDPNRLKFLFAHTKAYHDPTNSVSWTTFVRDNARFYDTEVEEAGQGQKALVLGWKTDARRTSAIAALWTLLSVALGVSVGVVCHDAGLGIAVTSVMATLLDFIAFVIAKLAK